VNIERFHDRFEKEGSSMLNLPKNALELLETCLRQQAKRMEPTPVLSREEARFQGSGFGSDGG